MLPRGMFKLLAPKILSPIFISLLFIACGGGSGDSDSSGGDIISAGTPPGGVSVGGGSSVDSSTDPVAGGGVAAPSSTTSGTTGGVTGGGGGTGVGGGTDTRIPINVNLTDDGQILAVDFSTTLDNSNFVGLSINISNATAFQVITLNSGGLTSTSTLVNPQGETVLSSEDDPLKTLGVLPTGVIGTLNYPTSSLEAPVTDGVFLQDILANFNPDFPDFSGFVLAKNDTDLSSGLLPLNIFVVGNEAQNGSTRIAITMASEIMRAVYQQVSVDLQINFIDVTSAFGVIPNPGLGSSFFTDNASSAAAIPGGLNLFVGETISTTNTESPGSDFDNVLGISSSIPGPAIVSPFSAVAVSILEHQGPDGNFSAEEISVFGETFAHESGHYLGLFHPVETDFQTQDPLPDTAFCSSLTECSNVGLTSNLMFPTAVSGILQRDLSPQQGGVMNRHLLVN